MVRFELDVEDLADTRFALSPLAETACSLWALADPGRYPLHEPWVRAVTSSHGAVRAPLLPALVGPTFALPDFLTPRPASPAPAFADELAVVRATDVDVVRRDLRAAYHPAALPPVLAAAADGDDAAAAALLEAICGALAAHWERAIAPWWPRIRLVLEADTTYRARRLATGGARALFADMHPNLRWADGALHIADMLGRHRVAVAGRGLLLMPSAFAYKPVPPLVPHEPPWLLYPARGLGSLFAPAEVPGAPGLVALLGRPRARLVTLLAEPAPTVELARRLGVTPSAVCQHLRVLHATGLVARARAGRLVLYRRTPLADELVAAAGGG